MKYLSLTCLVILLLACYSGARRPAAVPRWRRGDLRFQYSTSARNLFGPVKTVEHTYYEPAGAAVPLYSQRMGFDTGGNITAAITRRTDGSNAKVETFQYNEKGAITDLITKERSLGEEQFGTTKVHFRYDGNVRLSMATGASGCLLFTDKTVYDAQGREQQHSMTSAFGKEETGYEYDTAGRLYRTISINGPARSATTLLFDTAGNETGNYNEDKDTYRVAAVFDRFGNQMARNDSLVYDAHNNWTKKYRLREGQPVLAEERVITYYSR